MNKTTLIIFFSILFLAIFLRFWQLGGVPASPDWDEAALGYNAYSIMQTGRDEYGKFLPVVLRSFDDYKPAFYAYLVIPFIKLMGLSVLAVRIPSALMGVLTVVAVFFLVREIFDKYKYKDRLALLSAMLLAISPWHIQFSRIAFESNVGVAFNVFAAMFFLKGLRKPWLLMLSAIFMALNLYVYQSEKVFAPLLAIALVVIFRKKLFALPKKYIILAAVVGLLFSLPILEYTLTNKEALSRAQGVSVFSEGTELLKDNAQKLLIDRERNDILGIVLDNRRVVFAKSIIAGYLSHFDLNWLFINGDLARHHAPNMGLLYIFELPFLFIGIYLLLFGKFEKSTKFFIFLWFLIVPIPASITTGVPHAVRTLNFLPIFQIFTALGLLGMLGWLRMTSNKIRYLALAMVFLFFVFNFSYYLNQYFIQQNYFNSKDWQYGYEEAVSIVSDIEKKYDKVIVSNKPYMDQSYMFFLFYLSYPPSSYHRESIYASGGFRENHVFGKYEFRPIEWDKENKTPNILYVGLASDFPPNARIIKTIYFLDGSPAISIVEG